MVVGFSSFIVKSIAGSTAKIIAKGVNRLDPSPQYSKKEQQKERTKEDKMRFWFGNYGVGMGYERGWFDENCKDQDELER